MKGTCCLELGFIFVRRKDSDDVCVFSILTRARVHVGVCMCIYTHTHTLRMGYSDVSPRVRTRHLEGPKKPDGLIRHIYISICVQGTHGYIYARSPDEMLD